MRRVRVRSSAPHEVALEVEVLAAEGFDAFTLESIDRGGALDLARLGAARWAAGPKAELRVDFQGALEPAAAGVILASLRCFQAGVLKP